MKTSLTRADLLDAICDACKDYKGPGTCGGCEKVQAVLNVVPDSFKIPVHRAMWLFCKSYKTFDRYMCSNCGRFVRHLGSYEDLLKKYPYCHCGTKMDWGDGT